MTWGDYRTRICIEVGPTPATSTRVWYGFGNDLPYDHFDSVRDRNSMMCKAGLTIAGLPQIYYYSQLPIINHPATMIVNVGLDPCTYRNSFKNDYSWRLGDQAQCYALNNTTPADAARLMARIAADRRAIAAGTLVYNRVTYNSTTWVADLLANCIYDPQNNIQNGGGYDTATGVTETFENDAVWSMKFNQLTRTDNWALRDIITNQGKTNSLQWTRIFEGRDPALPYVN